MKKNVKKNIKKISKPVELTKYLGQSKIPK